MICVDCNKGLDDKDASFMPQDEHLEKPLCGKCFKVRVKAENKAATPHVADKPKRRTRKPGQFVLVDASLLLNENIYGAADTMRACRKLAESIEVKTDTPIELAIIRVRERLTVTRPMQNVVKRVTK
jgi:hypothetical protein